MTAHLAGLVVQEQSGFYWVEAEDGTIYTTRLRGKLKADAQSSDIAAIGDRVTIVPVEEDGTEQPSAVIQAVHPRHSALSRAVRTTGKRGAGQAEREHVLIANLDQAFFVFAAAEPTPNWQLLDRLLVTAEREEIADVVILINKMDLGVSDATQELLRPYERMGYPVLYTSAMHGAGVSAVRNRLKDKISVFTGPSGVGKTSLLNCIQPGLGRTVKSVSEYSQEGVHTTRDSALIKLNMGGYLADTPGIRYMNVWDVEPDELDAYFVDIAELAPQCKFRDCSHRDEPGCKVREALASGDLSPRRYEHFLQLREELKETYVVY